MINHESVLITQKFKTLDAIYGHVWEISRYDEDNADIPSADDIDRLRSVLHDFYNEYESVKCHVFRALL